MIHKCLSNGCQFDDESGDVFVVCPVCGYDMDGIESIVGVDVVGGHEASNVTAD